MILRPYQEQLITEAREAFKQGHREVILMSPTGSGKSVVIRRIFELAKGKCLFVVHRRILIKQMQETLKGLDVEIQTLQKAGKTKTDRYSLIVHDECHYSWNSKLKNNLNSDFYLGLSATPTTSDGYPLKCDKIISFMQMKELIDLGYAVPFKVLAKPKVETKGLKVSGGDFNNKASFELMNKASVTKDIVKEYNKYCIGKKSLLYAVNIQHAELLLKQFQENGTNVQVIHSKKDCETIIEDFKNNKIDLLINVSILTIGFDDGDVEVLILAAPTRSVVLAQQIYGRVSRLPIKTNKKEGLILDLADVVENTMHPIDKIDMNRKKDDKNIKKCTSCNETTFLINREVTTLNEFEYQVISTYRCKCDNEDIVESIKLFDEKLCESCMEVIAGTPIVMNTNDKDIKFVQKCECGHENITRTILLSNAELKEITTNKIMTGAVSEKQILMLLRAECKKFGYKHQYSIRLYETMQNKNISMQDMKKKIEEISKSGKKISMLQFWDGN